MQAAVKPLNHEKCLFTCLARSSWTERFSMVWHRSGPLAIGTKKERRKKKKNHWLVVSQNLSKQNLHLKEKMATKIKFITDTFHIHKIQHNI